MPEHSSFRIEKDTEHCQEPSSKYLKSLDENMDDPRSVAGEQAIKDGSWMPTIDSRDARSVRSEADK